MYYEFMTRFYIMKLNKFTVVLAILLVSILAIGAVSAESVDDAGIVAVADGDIQESVEVTDTADDLSTANIADETVEDAGAAVLGDEPQSYDLDDDSYSTYFNEDGTATAALSAAGDYTLNVGTLTNKDIKITSGSQINIIGKEGAGIINNGTITIGDGTGMAGSITISGLTFTNTNKNAVDVKDLSTKITIKDNTMNIVGITPEDSEYFSVYGINANGFISGLNIENNNIFVTGDASYSYGIQLGSYGALANPEDIVISNNVIDVNVGDCVGEGIYLDNPNNVLVEANNVTVANTGDFCAYGIQVADSAQYVFYYAGYEGTLTSPRNVLIKDNNVDVSSDFMVYAITALSFGADGYDPDMAEYDFNMPLCYQFDLNTTIANNTVVAKSKKGVIGIGGQIYNMTVEGNDVTAIGTSAADMNTGDALGNHTSALCVQFNAASAEDDYYIVVKDNKVTTNVLAEEINSESYREYVSFENNEVDQGILISDDTYANYFNDDGTLKDDAPITAGDLILLGELTNKKLVFDTGVTIRGVPGEKLVNTTINLVQGADNSVIEDLDMEFTGDDTTGSIGIIYIKDVTNVTIQNNKIVVPNFVDKTGSKWGSSVYAIEVESGDLGSSDITINNNEIFIEGTCRYLYGIDVFANSYPTQQPRITNVNIFENYVSLNGGSRMAEAIYVSACDDVVIDGNTISSTSNGAAYGVATDQLSDAVIASNDIKVDAATQAYGITATTSGTDTIIRGNEIDAKGTGAVGIGINKQDGVIIEDNKVAIDGGDYTTITSSDSLGTANAAILVGEGNTNVEMSGNDVTETSAVRLDTAIEVSDMTVTAAPSGEGKLEITLKTVSGMLLANQTVKVVFDNAVYELTTDAKGVAVLPFALNKGGSYNVDVFYLGDDNYRGSDATAKLTINKIKTAITASGKTFLATATTKKLTATLKDANGNVLANKKVTFTVNGKTYTATTNAKGVATVKLALKAAKTYTVSIKFAGDSVYAASTKSVKVKLNKEKTKITAPKKTFKRTAKTKKVVITLKNSKGKAIAKKKVTLIVNKKKYTVKTNKKGKATFKVKLTKKGTFKYTAKFAGDTQYKAVKKTGKIKIK